ncbi:MAG: Fur family transcriptional regulator [Pseudobdellovibrionaceae bacterium]|jgi:Fur family ferric uptake transcriptional regulator|nr:Fur family transcriptional regulator [Pseudobdellovibrionaceae bacterium]
MNHRYYDILKQKNLSLTAVRLSLLEAIEEQPHSDANVIFANVQRKIPSVTIQAVYNNLNALSDAGIIREIKPKGSSSLYETRIDDNHHHVICRSCGKIGDTECKGCAPCLVPTDSHGFQLDEAEVVFWGLCPQCQKSYHKQKEIK